MEFYVYVLRSMRNGCLYRGQTNNLQRRITQHNSKKAPATRYQGPYKVVHVEIVYTRSESVRRETFLKSGRGREELQKLILNKV